MSRFVDADALLESEIRRCGRVPTIGTGYINEKNFESVLEETTTVDAVEVVRCRDCKHRGTDYCIFHIKGEPADEELLRKLDNDFCSYGERKDDGSDG